ncbi:Carboxylesterase family-domain-containing protein [Dendryphion nanum]|uniref:Carboxylic ester hydrolase n=1 Tax=Dendryphion nanum TaxID=256645 RepID=A0A9P9IT95_9PLEO|nr:Carboxylesterase family-domain-containing protein [Dendryphion nanum]
MRLLANFTCYSSLLLSLITSGVLVHGARTSVKDDVHQLNEKRGRRGNGTFSGSPTAFIDAGIVIGTTTAFPAATATVNKFLGIPFASSPPERFSPPTKVPKSYKPINATSWKPACIQQFRYPPASQEFTQRLFNNPRPQESEDCLYLNVYSPSTEPSGDGRAVLFWIFGGSLQFGTAGQPDYDGSAFAAYEDIIVVTANYRTNVFGFPNSPEIPVTENNLGFLDQRFALKWVQKNIRAFGGDPNKVTIFGESAGGYAVDALLTSYGRNSSPPFRAAILQSGQQSYRPSPTNNSLPQWHNLTTQLGCPGTYTSNLTCVRAANASAIQQIINKDILIFSPIFDNVTFLARPAHRRVGGNIARIPVLGGTNANEGRTFVVNQTNITSWLQKNLGDAVPTLLPTIEAAYSSNSSKSSNRTNNDALAQIYTDWIFQCPQALWANATAATGTPTWRYYFNASFNNAQRAPGYELGVYHASEIQLVFRTYRPENVTTQQYVLSQFIQSAWAKFAKNPWGGPGWNRVGTGAEGSILSGIYDQTKGGVYRSANSSLLRGTFDLAVLGDVGNVKGSGATIVDSKTLDWRCGIWREVYEKYAGKDAMPPGS